MNKKVILSILFVFLMGCQSQKEGSSTKNKGITSTQVDPKTALNAENIAVPKKGENIRAEVVVTDLKKQEIKGNLELTLYKDKTVSGILELKKKPMQVVGFVENNQLRAWVQGKHIIPPFYGWILGTSEEENAFKGTMVISSDAAKELLQGTWVVH